MNETTITILEISDNGSQLKVKGQGQDGTHTYSVFKAKSDGGETQAYSLLKTKQVGQQITFAWKEYHGTRQTGETYISRTVNISKEATQQVNYQAPQAPVEKYYSPTPPKPFQSNKEDDIRANVALKMVSEIIAGGKIDIKDWKVWADTFYHYKPAFSTPIKPKESSGDWQETSTDRGPQFNAPIPDFTCGISQIPF
jgi:hypothetical protein